MHNDSANSSCENVAWKSMSISYLCEKHQAVGMWLFNIEMKSSTSEKIVSVIFKRFVSWWKVKHITFLHQRNVFLHSWKKCIMSILSTLETFWRFFCQAVLTKRHLQYIETQLERLHMMNILRNIHALFEYIFHYYMRNALEPNIYQRYCGCQSKIENGLSNCVNAEKKLNKTE